MRQLKKNTIRFISLFFYAICSITVSYAANIPNISILNQKIEQINIDANLSEKQKENSIRILQKAIQNIKEIQDLEAQAIYYKNTLEQASTQQSILQKKLAEVHNITLPRNIESASLAKLRSALTKSKIELIKIRKRYTDIDIALNQEKSLDLQKTLEDSRNQYQIQKNEYHIKTAQDINSTETLYQLTELRLTQTKINAIEQQLLSKDVRHNLLEIELKLFEKKIIAEEEKIAKLKNIINDHQQNEAERSITIAQKTLVELPQENKNIIYIAQQNILFAEKLKTLMQDYDPVSDMTDNVMREIKRLQQRYASLTQQLTITQLESSAAFGIALRQQKELLDDLDIFLDQITQQEILLTETRVAQFQIDLERNIEIQTKIADIFSKSPQQSALYSDSIIEDIINQRTKLLKQLSAEYGKYIEAINQLLIQLNNLKNQKEAYTILLNKQLLWIPNAPIFNINGLLETGNIFLYAIQHLTTQRYLVVIQNNLKENFAWILIISMLSLGILLLRPYLNSLLSNMQERVGKVNRDSLHLTFIAIAISLFIALFTPLLIIALFLVTSNIESITPAVLQATYFYFVIGFIIHSLHPGGLTELHFKWSANSNKILRTNLKWFAIVFLPLLFIVLITEQQDNLSIRDSLGRSTYILAALLVALLSYRITSQLYTLRKNMVKQEAGKSQTTYLFFFFLLVCIPVLLTLLAIVGYYYTALQLASYLIYSTLIFITGIYAFYLARRTFAIRERRLALNRARAKRAANSADNESKETAEMAGDNIHFAVDEQNIDLQTINTHTTTVLKMLIIIAVSLGLWYLWTEIFTAFQWLDNIILWNFIEVVNGSTFNNALTLWDLILTIVIIVITSLAAKNLPGLMEIALLNQLSLAAGTNYAVTTILRYAIVIFGSITVLQLLGAEWSKLHWLVAALGVGIGFGLQEIIANFVSGILILFERPIRIGDTVTVGDQFGTVSRIRIRATTITDWDRREIIIPNKTFITERLTNWTLTDPINRTIIKVGVAYGSDIALVERCLLDIATHNPKVITDPPPAVLFLSFGDSSLNFELRVFVKGMHDLNPVIHELHVAIDQKFREQSIEIAFPQHDLNFGDKPVTIQFAESQTTKRSP